MVEVIDVVTFRRGNLMLSPFSVRSLASAVALAALLVPTAAFAVPVVLTLEDSPIVQQANNSPCVIGNPSCNNPVGLTFTTIPSNTEAAELSSPTYSVDQIRGIVGNTFVVGIDLQEPDDDYTLNSFTLTINSIVQFVYSGGSIALQNHGNGFSDYVLTLFDLSPYLGTDTLVFTANFDDAQAAREQFFLVASTPVPEPMTASLLLAGVAGAAVRRRRKA